MTIKDNGDGTFCIVAPCSFENPSREEALKLADWLEDGEVEKYDIDEASAMIRRLVEELDRLVGAEPITHGKLTFCKNCGQQDPYTQTKPLSVEEIEGAFYKKCWYYDADEKFDYYGFAREIEERHGIK